MCVFHSTLHPSPVEMAFHSDCLGISNPEKQQVQIAVNLKTHDDDIFSKLTQAGQSCQSQNASLFALDTG